MIGQTPAESIAIDRVFDVRFASPGGHDLFADLYLPRGVARRPPVIVWLHGGGWKHGDRKLAPDLGRHFASQGFAMVSVDYRLSTTAPFPAQVEDVKTAIRWLRAVSDEYGLESDAIGLMGSSAGGHLAAIASLSGDDQFHTPGAFDDVSSRVQAVVDAYGPIDFLTMDDERDALAPGEDDDPRSVRVPPGYQSAAADSFESLLVGAPIGSRPDLVRCANPVTYATRPDVPFLILHGRSDRVVPFTQSEHLYDALSAGGGEVTLALIDGLGHGFLNRTDLDDQGPRAVSVRWRRRHGSEETTTQQARVFSTIADFFATHLRTDVNPSRV